MSVRSELECITGKMIYGDITPIVFDLIKDSGVRLTRKDIYSLLLKESTDVSTETRISATFIESSDRPSVEKLLRQSRRV